MLYGRFEARLKLPAGRDFGRVSGCWYNKFGQQLAEMRRNRHHENVGKSPNPIRFVHGAEFHARNQRLDRDDHANPPGRHCQTTSRLRLEWEPDAIRFYLDANLYGDVRRGAMASRRAPESSISDSSHSECR